MYYAWIIDHSNQNPLNLATCVSFKFLKEVPVSAFSPGMSYRWLFIVLVREEELFQRFLLGLFHYNNSYSTGQETNKRSSNSEEHLSQLYSEKPGSAQHGGLWSQQVRCEVDLSKDCIYYLTSHIPSLLGLLWQHIRAARGIVIRGIHQS